jgi:hypothetical protein
MYQSQAITLIVQHLNELRVPSTSKAFTFALQSTLAASEDLTEIGLQVHIENYLSLLPAKCFEERFYLLKVCK